MQKNVGNLNSTNRHPLSLWRNLVFHINFLSHLNIHPLWLSPSTTLATALGMYLMCSLIVFFEWTEWHVLCAGFLTLSGTQDFRIWYTHNYNDDDLLIYNLIFTTQRQAISVTYPRRHETSDICCVTKEDILVFWFHVVMFKLLLCVFPHRRVQQKFREFLPFLRNLCVPDDYICLFREYVREIIFLPDLQNKCFWKAVFLVFVKLINKKRISRYLV